MRIVIVGGPRSGKSTIAASLAARHGYTHYCTDPISLVKEPIKNVTYLPEGLEWGKDSEYVCGNWFTKDKYIIEGVGTVRALRKWDGKPDMIIVFKDKIVDRTDGQEAMAKSVITMWDGISSKYKDITHYL